MSLFMDLNKILREIEANFEAFSMHELKQFNDNFKALIKKKLTEDLEYFSPGATSSVGIQQSIVEKNRKRAAPKFEGYFLSPDCTTVWSKWSQGRFPNAFKREEKSYWTQLSEREFCEAVSSGKQVAKATLGYDKNHSTLDELLDRNLKINNLRL